MIPISLVREVRPTTGQKRALRTMLRSLLGTSDFDRLCLGMKVGTVDEDVLEVSVPAQNCAIDIELHHSDDIAVAAEYALGHPIQTVKILVRGLSSASTTAINPASR